MSENYWGKNAIELHYVDCEHTRFIPRGHTADLQHCYGCNPELAKVPLPGCCEDCRVRRISNTELIRRKIDQRWPQAYQSVMRFRVHQSSVTWAFPVQLKRASQSQR